MACLRVCPVSAITGSRRQPHSIDPHLCISCDACGRICPQDAVLDQHGALIVHTRRSDWPQPVWMYERCVACKICVQGCPAGVIGLQSPDGYRDRTAFPFLTDARGCLGCAFCASLCPVDAIAMRQPPADALRT